MPCLDKKAFFADYVFKVYEMVYEPAEDSLLFAENLRPRKDEVVLDVGTGCGILAVVVAERASRVVAVDVNPYAVKCAKENATLNGVADRISIIQGDLFASIRAGERFDLILFNAPYLPSEPSEEESWLERAWNGGVAGRKVINRFICRAPKYLRDSGRILLMQSTLSNIDETIQRFAEKGLKTTVVAELPVSFFETIILVRAARLQLCERQED